MSSGLNSWTREVVCQAVIPIRIDPKATAEEAEEQVKQLIRDRCNGVLTIDQLTIFAIPLTEEEDEEGIMPPEVQAIVDQHIKES